MKNTLTQYYDYNYVSPDDIELTREQFLQVVADRINDDLPESISRENDYKNALEEIWRRTGHLLLQCATRLKSDNKHDLLIIEALNANQQTAKEALYKEIV